MASSDWVSPTLIDLIYGPSVSGVGMNCVAFASGSGTNFEQAVLEAKGSEKRFSIDLLVTDKEESKGKEIGAIGRAKKLDVPYRTLNGFKFCGSWQKAKTTSEGIFEYLRKSTEFDMEILKLIQAYETEKEITFDLAILAGYMRLVKAPLLRRFNNRVINVHPARLDVLNEDGTRKFVGDNAVYDALKSGETKTRSSIFLVDSGEDSGTILTSGPWVSYDEELPITEESASRHQDIQKAVSDWPALIFTLRAISEGRFGLHREKFWPDGNPIVTFDGRELPYQGIELKLTQKGYEPFFRTEKCEFIKFD